MISSKKHNIQYDKNLINMSVVSKISKQNDIKNFYKEIVYTSLIKNSIYLKNFSFVFYKKFKSNNTIKNIPSFFNSSSSTIIKHPIIDNRYILNIRCVNYNLNLLGGSSIKHNDICLTSNVIIILDAKFNIIYKNIIYPDINNSPYIGIEDIRLFKFNNKVFYIGSAYDINTNKIKITSSEHNIHESFKLNFIDTMFETKFDWEKNWVFFENNDEMFIIYKWFPITICKINYVNKKLNLIKTLKTPDNFYNFRGSTNGVLFENKIWFIVHSQLSFEGKKHYYHSFVILNKDFTVHGYSKNFKFENYLVEFCIGFEVSYNNNFIITYSTLDRTTKMAIFTPEFIKSIIIII